MNNQENNQGFLEDAKEEFSDVVSEVKNELDLNDNSKKEIINSLVDTDKIVLNPTKNLYQVFADNFSKSFDKFYDDNIESKTKINEVSNKVQQEIVGLRNDISNKYKENKVGARRFANVMIIIFSFILIGLFFVMYFPKNRKKINEYKEFEKEKSDEISEAINLKTFLMCKAFSKYNINQIKNMLLNEYSIEYVKNINRNEIAFIQNVPHFLAFNSITKYEVRNAFLYDVLYTTKYYHDVVTSASITISTTNSNGTTTSYTITATHSEPTPYIDYEVIYTMPTNYLPGLSFRYRGTISKKELAKRRKQGKTFVCENDDFTMNFDYDFNDELKFVQYFPLVSQQKFVDFYNYFVNKGINNFPINKEDHNLYSNIYINSLTTYKTSSNLIYEKIIENKSNIVASDISKYIKNSIYDSCQKIFQFLTMAYSNKSICIEVYDEMGRKYSFDYKDYKKDLNNITDNYLALVNLFSNVNVFSFRYNEFAYNKPAYFVPAKFYKTTKFIIQDINMRGWYSRNEIDAVYKSGYVINVPYVRYYDIEEPKFAIFSSHYYLQNPQALILSGVNNYVSTTIDDNELDEIIKQNNIQINQNAIDNKKELTKYLRLIDKFYKDFPLLKNCSSFCINHDILAILIDDYKVILGNSRQYSKDAIAYWLEDNLD